MSDASNCFTKNCVLKFCFLCTVIYSECFTVTVNCDVKLVCVCLCLSH